MKKIIMIIILMIAVAPFFVKAEKNYQEEYIKITTYYINGEVSLTHEENITEEEYNNINPTKGTNCSSSSYPNCYETEYKALMLATYIYNNKYRAEMILSWKKVPVVTKYDDFGVRWTGTTTLYNVTGRQEATRNGSSVTTNYTMNGSTTKTASYGAGITMNMYDNATDHRMYMDVSWNSNPGTIYVSYQHARNSAINQTQAMNYSFSSSGLGDVFYFSNTTVRGYYDGMQGLSSSSFPILN